MKLAMSIFGRLTGSGAGQADVFDLRLKEMTSPAVTGPRLRRVMPPGLFGFRREIA